MLSVTLSFFLFVRNTISKALNTNREYFWIAGYFFIEQFFNIFLKSDTIKRYGTLYRRHCQQSNKNFASKSICPVESNRNETGQLNEIYIQSMSLVIPLLMACEDVTDISDRLKFSANIGRIRTVFIQSNIL